MKARSRFSRPPHEDEAQLERIQTRINNAFVPDMKEDWTLPDTETHYWAGSREATRVMLDDLRFLLTQLAKAQDFIADHVEPLRHQAIEVSERYEPCGYYCDESVGHVDGHPLARDAKWLYGDGVSQYLCPPILHPHAERIVIPPSTWQPVELKDDSQAAKGQS